MPALRLITFNNMYKIVVFDMAGTTIDEQNVVYKMVHKAIERAGYDVTLPFVLLHAAGKEKFQAIKDVLEQLEGGAGHSDELADIYRDFEELLDNAYNTWTCAPMAGAQEVFEALHKRGIKVVLNTGYRRAVAERLLQQIGWQEGRDFDWLCTADQVQRGRPYPDMIYASMEHFGVLDARQVAKIGDSMADIEEGKRAGCGIAAGITTGAQTAEQLALAGPTHIFQQLTDLLPLVVGGNSQQ